MTLSPEATAIYEAMLANDEGTTRTKKDGTKWASVYLDNARPKGMSVTSFRSYLRVLADAGKYEVYDGQHFGWVRLKD